jgi:hypothetical protein
MAWEIVTIDRSFRNDSYLYKAHERAAKRAGAVIGNFGWVTSDDAILSKTSKGKLETRFPEYKGGRYVHIWYDQE